MKKILFIFAILFSICSNNLFSITESENNLSDDSVKNTPFHFAQQWYGAINELKFTPLHFAAFNGNYDHAQELITSGADIHAQDCLGNTPLHYAIIEDEDDQIFFDKEVAKFLIDHGANIEAKNQQGLTPLHLAACNSKEKGIIFLLDLGANINAQTMSAPEYTPHDFGNTPLHFAVEEGSIKIIEILLARGANLYARNHEGQEPIDCAYEPNDRAYTQDIVDLLKKAMDEAESK